MSTSSPKNSETSIWSASTELETMDSFRRRYLELKSAHHLKDELIEDLLTRCDFATREQARLSRELFQERLSGRFHSRQPILKSENEVTRLFRQNACHFCSTEEKYLAILIDGNELFFKDEFVTKATLGGQRAALALCKSFNDYLQSLAYDPTISFKIVARVFADVNELAKVYLKAGIVVDKGVVYGFMSGFTKGLDLFDFVDAGGNRENKLIEMFKFHIEDSRCMQVFFGCSSESCFDNFLQPYSTNPAYATRVTLLGSPQTYDGTGSFRFPRKSFSDVFRTQDLPKKPQVVARMNGGTFGSGDDSLAHSVLGLSHSRSVPAEGRSSSVPATPRTWADLVSRPAGPVTRPTAENLEPPAAPRCALQITRNRHGQRIDPKPRRYDRAEVERVRRLKLCNVHYLRRDCPYGAACVHRHDYTTSADDLALLRLIVRFAPCVHGTACADPKCVHGHQCPAPAWRGPPGAEPPSRSKPCIFGDACRFSPELHVLDLQVVQTTRIT